VRQQRKPEDVICQYSTPPLGSDNPERDNSEAAQKEIRLIEYILKDNLEQLSSSQASSKPQNV
jgi:hypothetical protein